MVDVKITRRQTTSNVDDDDELLGVAVKTGVEDDDDDNDECADAATVTAITMIAIAQRRADTFLTPFVSQANEPKYLRIHAVKAKAQRPPC